MKNNQLTIHLRSFLFASFIVFTLYLAYKIFSVSESPTESRVSDEYGPFVEGSQIGTLQSADLAGLISTVALENKKVILHFWASWCAPCVTEMPELIQFAQSNKDVMIVAISQDSRVEEVVAFIKSFPEMKSKFTLLHDKNRTVAKQFNVNKLPESVVISNTVYLKKISGSVHWSQFNNFDSLLK